MSFTGIFVETFVYEYWLLLVEYVNAFDREVIGGSIFEKLMLESMQTNTKSTLGTQMTQDLKSYKDLNSIQYSIRKFLFTLVVDFIEAEVAKHNSKVEDFKSGGPSPAPITDGILGKNALSSILEVALVAVEHVTGETDRTSAIQASLTQLPQKSESFCNDMIKMYLQRALSVFAEKNVMDVVVINGEDGTAYINESEVESLYIRSNLMKDCFPVMYDRKNDYDLTYLLTSEMYSIQKDKKLDVLLYSLEECPLLDVIRQVFLGNVTPQTLFDNYGLVEKKFTSFHHIQYVL